MNNIYSWEFGEGLRGQFLLVEEVQLLRHTDYVKDILVVKNDLHSLLVIKVYMK